MRSSAGSGKTYSPSPVAITEQRRQRGDDLGTHLGALEPAGLDQGHERGRGVLVDLDERILVLDGLEVGMRADRGLGGDDAHPSGSRGQGGRRGARSDDAEDRHVVAARMVGSATADEVLQATTMALTSRAASSSRHSEAEADDLVIGPRAVRRARVVAKVDRRFARRSAERPRAAPSGHRRPSRRSRSDRRSGIALSACGPRRPARPAPPGSGCRPRSCAMSALMRADGSASTNGTPWLFDSTTSRPSLTSENSGSRPSCLGQGAPVRCRRSSPRG